MSENSSSCTLTDNEVIFSSTDHLEWNQKKHDMMLNLGLTNHNSEADQTPTPTRFIRNCEEVGLFQDLQNVNPFDEVFKKAVENPSSVSLKVPVSSSDDTLHTPQIYPHLEESLKFSSTATTATSNNYSLNSVISSTEHEGDDCDNPLIIVLEPESDDKKEKECTKNKFNIPQDTITSIEASSGASTTDKMKQQVIAAIIQKTSTGVTPVPIDKLIDQEKQHSKQEIDGKDVAVVLRQREANKAAQSRCRKRKQREFEQMSAEIQKLRKENLRLTGMNLYLQETIKNLESELRATKSPDSVEPNTLPKSARPSKTSPDGTHTQSVENKKFEPVAVGKLIKVNSPQQPNKLPLIVPNVKTVVVAAPNTIALPVQNIQKSSGKTMVVLCPGYGPSQRIIMPSTPILTQPIGVDLKSKAKTYKKIVPK